jgi:pilus assembly protein CpaF
MISPDIVVKTIESALPQLRPFFNNPSITEISVNPGGRVFVEDAGVMLEHPDISITEHDLVSAMKAIASLQNREVVSGKKSSILNASYDGMRIAGALKPVSPDGSFLSIRKHLAPDKRPTLQQLIAWGALTQECADFILHRFTKKLPPDNILLVGATGSGKTTYANAFLKAIPRHERVVTIEEVEELETLLDNVIRLITSPEADITARDLVRASLRYRPDRIIIGESRGEETYDLIRAFNSGHPGSLTTVHASSARLGLDVLEMLYQMSLPPNASISTDVVRKYIAGAVNMVIYVDRTYETQPDGSQKSIRKVKEVVLVKGVENGNYILVDWKNQNAPARL